MSEASIDATASKATSTWRRVGRWSVRLALVMVAVTVVYVAWTNHRGARAVAQLRQDLLDRGIPTDLTAWRLQHFGELDPARDGSHLYLAAMKVTQHLRDEFYANFVMPSLDEAEPPAPVSPEVAARAETFVTQYAWVFDLLAAARAYDQFDFGLIEHESPVRFNRERLTGFRELARWIELRLLHAHAKSDRMLAVESVLDLFRLVHAFEHEPTITAELIRRSVDTSASRAIEGTLSRLTLEPADLDAWRDAVRLRVEAADLVRLLESQLLCDLLLAADPDDIIWMAMATRKHYRELVESGHKPWLVRGAVWSEPPLATPMALPDAVVRVWLAICPGGRQRYRAGEAVDPLNAYDELVAVGNGSPAVFRYLAATEPTEQDDDDGSWVLNSSRVLLQIRTRLLVVETALAVEGFRMAYDRWPDDLVEVEAWLGDRLPADPYTGGALLYRDSEHGVVVYSVGPTLEDAGGRPPRLGPRGAPGESWDIVFHLYHPHLRNRPPADEAADDAAGTQDGS